MKYSVTFFFFSPLFTISPIVFIGMVLFENCVLLDKCIMRISRTTIVSLRQSYIHVIAETKNNLLHVL